MFGFLIFLLVGTIVVLCVDILFFKSRLIDLKKCIVWVGFIVFLSAIGIGVSVVRHTQAKTEKISKPATGNPYDFQIEIKAELLKENKPQRTPRNNAIEVEIMVPVTTGIYSDMRELDYALSELEEKTKEAEREIRELQRKANQAAWEMKMMSDELERKARDLYFDQLLGRFSPSIPSW